MFERLGKLLLKARMISSDAGDFSVDPELSVSIECKQQPPLSAPVYA